MTVKLETIASIVFPARDLAAGVAAWTAMLGSEPAWQNEDFASFGTGAIDISLSRLPWVDFPLVFWKVDDVAEAHRSLVAAGARPMVEIDGGTLVEIGTATAASGNQDPATGIVDMPGARLAVLQAADGNLFANSEG